MGFNASSLEFDGYYTVPQTDLSLGNVFNISQSAVESLSSFFQTTLTSGTEYFFGRNLVGCQFHGFYAYVSSTTGGPSMYDYSPGIMQPLYNSSNLTATFSTIVRSMSNAIREGDDNGNVQMGMAILLDRMGVDCSSCCGHAGWCSFSSSYCVEDETNRDPGVEVERVACAGCCS